MHKIKSAWQILKVLAAVPVTTLAYLFLGCRNKQFKNHLKQVARVAITSSQSYVRALKTSLELESQTFEATYLKSCEFTYSILVPVYHPSRDYLEKALKSALNQSAPLSEVIVGFDGPQDHEVTAVAYKLQQLYGKERLKIHEIDRTLSGGGISATTNAIAQHAQGRFLLLMDHDDFMQPNLLLHYEQALKTLPHPDQTVLYCDEYKIDEYDRIIPGSQLKKHPKACFPYVFLNFICHCLLVPKTLWEQAGGLRSPCDGAQDYDLLLRLDLLGARFHRVPLLLYAWRAHRQSTAKNASQKKYAIQAGILALSDYCTRKDLKWQISEGLLNSYRAIPQLLSPPSIHVIIVCPDQKNPTETVTSVLNQEGVVPAITLVGSSHPSPLERLSLNEPFDALQWMHHALNHSAHSSTTDQILLIRNGVELNPGALKEMARWINQPGIGTVGACLFYSQGQLYHGGIERQENSMHWIEQHQPEQLMKISRLPRIVDAVALDCALFKKESTDDSLCFYTPYATGKIT